MQRGGDRVEVRETYVTHKARKALEALDMHVTVESLLPIEGEELTVFADGPPWYYIWETGSWRLTFVTPDRMGPERGKFGVVNVQRRIRK